MFKIICPNCKQEMFFHHFDETWIKHFARCETCNKRFYFKIEEMIVSKATFVEKDYGFNLSDY